MSSSETVQLPPKIVAAGVRRWPADRFIYSAAITVGGAVVASHLIDFGSDNLRQQWLNADSDQSWSHKTVVVVLLLATLVALYGWRAAARRRREWMVATAVFAFLAVDELSSLHTQVDAHSWGKALYAPVLAVFAICAWRIARDTAERALIRVALAALVVSFAVHVFGPHLVSALGWGQTSWAYQVKVAVKEATELAGWLLAFAAFVALAFKRSGDG